MRLLSLLAVGGVVAWAGLSFATEVRTWVDATGKHKIEASYDHIEGENVVLISPSGKKIKIPKAKLSSADQGVCDEIAAAELRIREERTAAEVLRLLQQIADDKQSSAALESYVQSKLSHWQELADAGAIQYGGRWMAAEEVKKVQSEASRLMEQSAMMISVGNHKLARESLLKASKVDPEGIQADFTLGMLHALVGGKPKEARGRFLICMRRLESLGRHRTAIQNANLKAVFNNIALTEVRLNEVTSAIGLWERAASKGKVMPEIVQNIGRLSDVAAARQFLQVTGPTEKAIGLLYAKAATENSALSYDPSIGWLYIPYLYDAPAVVGKKPAPDRVSPAAAKPQGVAGALEMRVFATGSGFAVTDDLVITNRHVAEGAHAFQLGDGGAQERSRLSGELVAISKERDLALIRFPGLAAKPLKLRDGVPRLAADVRVLGYPESQVLAIH